MQIEQKPRLLVALDLTSVLLLAVATILVLFYAPLEAQMGAVQKVFYFHVSCAWAGMLSFVVAAVSGVVYLRNRSSFWDAAGLSAVEIGMVTMFIAIVSGSIWAKPIWNTWWTWDPRLTTVTVMELIYAAYFLLRQGLEDPERRARFSAIYTIIGFLSVPLMFFSIRIYRTIHPVIIGNSNSLALGAFNMTSPMLQTFIFCLVTFSFIFADLLWHRIRLELLARHIEHYKQSLE